LSGDNPEKFNQAHVHFFVGKIEGGRILSEYTTKLQAGRAVSRQLSFFGGFPSENGRTRLVIVEADEG